jgi:hypothetical protein
MLLHGAAEGDAEGKRGGVGEEGSRHCHCRSGKLESGSGAKGWGKITGEE